MALIRKPGGRETVRGRFPDGFAAVGPARLTCGSPAVFSDSLISSLSIEAAPSAEKRTTIVVYASIRRAAADILPNQ